MDLTVAKVETLVELFTDKHFKGKTGSGKAKLPEEVQEFLADPCLEEAADVLLCLLIELHQRNLKLTDLLTAAIIKGRINLEREWEKRPDGTIHHI